MANASRTAIRVVLVLAGISILLTGIIASFNLRKHRGALSLVLALIFLGGLARLTQMHPDTTFGPSILGSFLAELVGMPLLYFWLSKSVPGEQHA